MIKVKPISINEYDSLENKTNLQKIKSEDLINLTKEDIEVISNILDIKKEQVRKKEERELENIQSKISKLNELKQTVQKSIKVISEEIKKLDQLKKSLMSKIKNKID